MVVCDKCEQDMSLLECLQQTNNYNAVLFVTVSDKHSDSQRPAVIQRQLSNLGFLLSSSPDNSDTELGFDVESSVDETSLSQPVCDVSEGLGAQFAVRLSSFVKLVLQSRVLVAVNQLYDMHQRCLNVMIDSTFAAATDVACTPARLKYARDQEVSSRSMTFDWLVLPVIHWFHCTYRKTK